MSNQLVSWRRAAIAVAVASIVVNTPTVRAADNTPPVSATNIEKPWDNSVALGLSLTEGNSQSLLFTGEISGKKEWPDDELLLDLKGAYGKNTVNPNTPAAIRQVNNELLDGNAQYNHLFTQQLYGLVLVDALHDGVADLTYRVTAGPGVGYYFVKDAATKFAGEVGGAYIIQKYGSAVSHDFVTLRLADRFEHKFTDRARIWQTTEWLPQVDDTKNYLLNTEVGVEAALTKAMSLRIVGTHRYNSEPADDLKNYDLSLVSALAYKF